MSGWGAGLRPVLAGLVLLPALLAVLWSAWKGLELLVLDPTAPQRSIANLSESVALNDRARTFWMLEQGADPNVPYPVRAGVVFAYPVPVAPLEAAVFTREINTFELLLTHGAVTDEDGFRFLYCLAVDNEADALSAFILKRAGITADSTDCSPSAAIDSIRARGTRPPRGSD